MPALRWSIEPAITLVTCPICIEITGENSLTTPAFNGILTQQAAEPFAMISPSSGPVLPAPSVRLASRFLHHFIRLYRVIPGGFSCRNRLPRPNGITFFASALSLPLPCLHGFNRFSDSPRARKGCRFFSGDDHSGGAAKRPNFLCHASACFRAKSRADGCASRVYGADPRVPALPDEP
jgi:hypothetical protein